MKKNIYNYSRSFLFWSGWGHRLFFVNSKGVFMGVGENSECELNLGHAEDVTVPEKVLYFNERKISISDVSIGRYHTLFLGDNNVSYGCGKNTDGQTSHGRNSRRDFVKLRCKFVSEQAVKVKRVHADAYFSQASSFFLLLNGDVFSTGHNNYGQLGLGDKENRFIAEKIKTLKDIVKVNTGYAWSMFLSKQGIVYGTGYNTNSQMGLGDQTKRNIVIPMEIPFFAKNLPNFRVTEVVSTYYSTFFITEKRAVYVAGSNQCGQFGFQKPRSSNLPILSEPLCGFQEFCQGESYHFIVFKKNGKFYGCGQNCGTNGDKKYSRMGLGNDSTYSHYPSEIVGLRNRKVEQLVTSNTNTYALLSNGKIMASGTYQYGKMLDGGFGIEKGGTLEFEEVKNIVIKRRKVSNDDQKERILFLGERFRIIELNLFY